MRITFAQDSFHYNQVEWMEGFLREGWEVDVLVRRPVYEREYEFIHALDESHITNALFSLPIARLNAPPIKRKYAFPKLPSVLKYFRTNQPDIVVSKRYTPISMMLLLHAEFLNIPTVIYDQYPAFSDESFKRSQFRRAFSYFSNSPYVRTTPVKGDKSKYSRSSGAIYIPVGKTPGDARDPGSYFSDGKISLLCVGKLRQERKRHLWFMRLIHELRSDFDIKGTIVGSYYGKNRDYYDNLHRYIDVQNLEDIINIRNNIPHSKMRELYRNHDLFILPSRDEPAAYSLLEAMAESLPIICSDSNGTQCYIQEGNNGYVFQTNSFSDLKNKTRELIEDPDRIIKMGQFSRQLVKDNHQPTNFAQFITDFLDS